MPIWALVVVGVVSATAAAVVTAWFFRCGRRKTAVSTMPNGSRKRPPRLISRSTEAVNDMLLEVLGSVKDRMGLRTAIKQKDATRVGWTSNETTPNTTARSTNPSPKSHISAYKIHGFIPDLEEGQTQAVPCSAATTPDSFRTGIEGSDIGITTKESALTVSIRPCEDGSIATLICRSTEVQPDSSTEAKEQRSTLELQQCPSNTLCRNRCVSTEVVHGFSNEIPPETAIKWGNEQLSLEEVNIGRLVGTGGIASVYVGWYRGSEVAVKVLHETEQNSETSYKAFCSEVEVLRRLRHPNIIKLCGAKLQPPKVYIVEELAERGSLHSLLHDHLQKPEYGTFLQIAVEVADAMQYCHQLVPPVVHRDLKTQNILLTASGQVKIADFGIAKVKQSTFLDTKHLNAGTVAYMAPELFTGELIDEKIDVYSFGVILWECWTGQMPWFEADTPMHIVAMVGMHKKRLKIPDDMPRSLATLIRSCWRFDPRQRPSFAEISELLERILKKHSMGVPLSP